MTTLVVLVPPRPNTGSPADWRLPSLPFVLFDARDRRLHSAVAGVADLPAAETLVLVLAPADVALLRVRVPAISRARLRLALPNLVEEQLVQDANRCHFAIDGEQQADGTQFLAVVDRAWFRFVLDSFAARPTRRVRAVALSLLIDEPAAGEVAALLIDDPLALGGQDREAPQLILRDAEQCSAMRVTGGAVDTLIEHYARARTVRRARLVVTATDKTSSSADWPTLTWDGVAATALGAAFDLCQFEFAARRWQGVRENLRRWRAPLALLAACLVVSIIGLNLQWLLLARENAALRAKSEDLLREAFPKTTVVEDAPLQLTRGLQALRAGSGELAENDFLALGTRLADALGKVPPSSITALDYSASALTVTLASGYSAPAGTLDSLRQAGLSVEETPGKWVIRSTTR